MCLIDMRCCQNIIGNNKSYSILLQGACVIVKSIDDLNHTIFGNDYINSNEFECAFDGFWFVLNENKLNTNA